MITNLEPDILECKVKWALGCINMRKASGDDGIPAELFQILKDDAVKLLHTMCQQIWKTQQWPQDWKRSVFTTTVVPIQYRLFQKYTLISRVVVWLFCFPLLFALIPTNFFFLHLALNCIWVKTEMLLSDI